MKRMSAILLALALLVSLCACGSNSEPVAEEPQASAAEPSVQEETATEATSEPTPETTPEATPEPTPEPVAEIWTLSQTVDEFGDVTDTSETWMTSTVTGDFSNTATASSELTVDVAFIYNADNNQYVAQFHLFEYNDHPATYSDYDDLQFKMKIDDEIYEYTLVGIPPNGGLAIGVADYDYGGNRLFNELFSGNDVRCIINIGSSQYNFTVESGNLQQLSDSFGLTLERTKMSAQDAAKVFLTDDGTRSLTARTGLIEAADEIELMDNDAINALIEGYFLLIVTGTYTPIDDNEYCWWYGIEYSCSGGYGQTNVDYCYTTKLGGYRAYSEINNSSPSLELRVENDTLIVLNTAKGIESTYQCRRITDDVIVLYLKNDDGSFTPSNMMVRCDDLSQTGISNGIQNALAGLYSDT